MPWADGTVFKIMVWLYLIVLNIWGWGAKGKQGACIALSTIRRACIEIHKVIYKSPGSFVFALVCECLLGYLFCANLSW